MLKYLKTSEQVFVQNELSVGCFPAFSIFLQWYGIPAVCPDEFVVKNFTGVNRILNSTPGVSTNLTWEMKFNQTFYKALVLVSITINWNAVKGQLCIRLVELILKMRVRSVRLQTFSLTTKIRFGNSTDNWTFRRLRKKLFFGNCQVYHTPCSRQQKRFQF